MVGQTGTNVTNSAYFVWQGQSIQIYDRHLLVSFYKNSLLTKMPVTENLKIVAKKNLEEEALEERSTLSTGSISQIVDLGLKYSFSIRTVDFGSRRMVNPRVHHYPQLLAIFPRNPLNRKCSLIG